MYVNYNSIIEVAVETLVHIRVIRQCVENIYIAFNGYSHSYIFSTPSPLVALLQVW